MIFISQGQWMRLLNSFNPMMLIYIFSKFIISTSYRILSRGGVPYVSVLKFAYKLADYAIVRFLITYLTVTINHPITQALVLTNIRKALSGCLRIVAVYISESRLGHIKVITFSTLSFTLGLALLYISTVKYSYPSVIIGIFLLAVGKAGLQALLEPFLSHQLKVDEPETNSDNSRVKTQKSVCKGVITSSPAVIAILLRLFFEWQIILLIATSSMGSACFLFWCGIRLYQRRELAGVGSGFSVIFRVIKAFVLQIRILGYPTSSNHLVNYDNDNDENKFQLSPKINWLRGLDKVAIIESSTHSQEEEKKFGRICSASQVQLVKRFLSMIPMWTTILVVGLVISTGSTFFPEQGTNMKSSEFSTCLLIFQGLSRAMGSHLLSLFIQSKYMPEAKKNTAIQAGIWGGIVSSILCSSVAWQVEHRKVTIIGVNDLIDKPDKKIPMSIFRLSPQFVLLGLTEGFVGTGLDEFTVDQFSDPWKEYVTEINEFVVGLGNFLSMLFIQANKSLFGDTLNNSQLDKYFYRITIVSYGNMFFYFLVVYFFYGSRFPNISGGTSSWLIPDEERRNFLEKEKGLISSTASERYENINHHEDYWKLLEGPQSLRSPSRNSTE